MNYEQAKLLLAMIDGAGSRLYREFGREWMNVKVEIMVAMAHEATSARFIRRMAELRVELADLRAKHQKEKANVRA